MLETQTKDFNRVRDETGSLLQQFLRDLISFEHHKSYSVELDTFSLAVSKKFDDRMDQYEERVHKKAQFRKWTSGALTIVACLSVFLVWSKVRTLKRKFLL